MGINSTCAQLPGILDLHFDNIYWQQVHTTKARFHLYSAHLDIRREPTVRIVGLIDWLESDTKPSVKTYCQLWFDGSEIPEVSEVLSYRRIVVPPQAGQFIPYLMSCNLPKTHLDKVPAAVSLVENQCDTATSNLRVIYNKLTEAEDKKKFAVCVKGLDFPDTDISVRLIEWIELLTALGVDKIFFYKFSVHPNVTKVLDHYSKEGKVEVTPISLPAHLPNIPGLRSIYIAEDKADKRNINELIPYNDCFYRNIYRSLLS